MVDGGIVQNTAVKTANCKLQKTDSAHILGRRPGQVAWRQAAGVDGPTPAAGSLLRTSEHSVTANDSIYRHTTRRHFTTQWVRRQTTTTTARDVYRQLGVETGVVHEESSTPDQSHGKQQITIALQLTGRVMWSLKLSREAEVPSLGKSSSVTDKVPNTSRSRSRVPACTPPNTCKSKVRQTLQLITVTASVCALSSKHTLNAVCARPQGLQPQQHLKHTSLVTNCSKGVSAIYNRRELARLQLASSSRAHISATSDTLKWLADWLRSGGYALLP